MRVELAYGNTGLEVEVPDGNLAGVLGFRPVPPLPDPEAAVRRSLADPIGSLPLGQVARGRRDACVAVCDITRPVPNRLLLPPLLETLEGAGIPRERITLLIATGMHRANEGDELVTVVGPDIRRRYRIANHDSRDLESHRLLGHLEGGTPIYLDARYCEADLKVVTGLIEPHLFAGYSGGRKVVCPGLAALPTVEAFHATRLIEHPAADSGILAGNPVHAMALEVARAAGVDFSANVTIDEGRRLTGVFAGDLEAAWEAGVAQVRAMATAHVEAPVDVVVTSGGGSPLDATFYQTIKGMVGALPILKPGGTILLAARLREGIGSPEFARLLLESGDLERLMDRVRDPGHFVVDQWGVVALAKVLRHAEVLYCTEGLPADLLRRLYVEPTATLEDGLRRTLAKHGADARIAVIPKGPYVMPRVGPVAGGQRTEQ